VYLGSSCYVFLLGLSGRALPTDFCVCQSHVLCPPAVLCLVGHAVDRPLDLPCVAPEMCGVKVATFGLRSHFLSGHVLCARFCVWPVGGRQ